MEGRSWEKGPRRKRERARQRGEDGGRGGEERIRMDILHFGAKNSTKSGQNNALEAGD